MVLICVTSGVFTHDCIPCIFSFQCHIRMSSSNVEVASINTLEGDEQGEVFLTVNRPLKVHGNSSVDSLHISGNSGLGRPFRPPFSAPSGLPLLFLASSLHIVAGLRLPFYTFCLRR